MNAGEEFVIKEFEVMHESVALHYRIIERIFYLYAIVASIPFLATAYLFKAPLELIISRLTWSLLVILFFVVFLGVIIFRLVIEHKLKAINYMRNINGIRAFMISKHNDIKGFSIMPTSTDFPNYFDIFRDFFWEASLIAITNSFLVSLLIIDISDIKPTTWRIVGAASSFLASLITHFLWYKRIAGKKY